MRCLIVLLVSSGVHCIAEELDDVAYQDVRLGFSAPPAALSGSYTSSRGTSSPRVEAVEFDQRGRLSLGWVPWPSTATEYGAGMCQLEVSYLRYVLDGDDLREALDQRVLLATAHLGIGWVPAAGWTIETTGYGGLGGAWQPGNSDHGGAFELGLRVQALWAWGGALLGASLGYGWLEWEAPAHLDGADYELRFRGAGFTPGLLAGWRF
jgi:hypothetical protein